MKHRLIAGRSYIIITERFLVSEQDKTFFFLLTGEKLFAQAISLDGQINECTGN